MESDFALYYDLDRPVPSLFSLSLKVFAQILSYEFRAAALMVPLPTEVANILFQTMCRYGLLSQNAIYLFAKQRNLTKVDLTNCFVHYSLFKVFRFHRLRSLTLRNSTFDNIADVRHVLADLGPRVESALRHFDISGNCSKPVLGIATIARLKNLTSLVLAETPLFTPSDLRVICEELHMLKYLDISHAMLYSISPLALIKDSLETLIIHHLSTPNAAILNGAINVLRKLTKLIVLDVSDKRVDFVLNSIDEAPQTDLGTALVQNIVDDNISCWPNLRSIDIAGNSLNFQSIIKTCDYITAFISLHPNLEFISILDTSLNRHPYHYPFPRKKPLLVANGGTRTQCLLALQHYWRWNREIFTAHALQALYYMLQSSYDEFKSNDLRLTVRGVVLCMRNHISNLAIQKAGSACLYHLCKLDRTNKLTPMETRQCVERCLDASEKHCDIIQLQKNVWLTICNDLLLHTQMFDMLRTCEVALEAMIKSRDVSVSRMTIAVVSILIPKIPTSLSRRLATNERYLSYLIEVIRHEPPDSTDNNLNDYTVKFTLSALWNLTDESPQTCQCFVKLNGLKAAHDLLLRFSEKSYMLAKVLGLLNNVAEVKELKHAMLASDCFVVIYRLLDCDNNASNEHERRQLLDVSYFAAGIISNLILVDDWCYNPTRDECNHALMKAVNRWPKTIATLVSYRSFVPFFMLLSRDDLPGAQMWAAWAIRQVCLNDIKCGLERFIAQGGSKVVNMMIKSQNINPSAAEHATHLLDLIGSR